MIKKALWVVVAMILLAGCGPKGIEPGETAEINTSRQFYFGIVSEDNSALVQSYLEGKTEQEKIAFLLLLSGKYQVLPEEARLALLEEMEWITPEGVSVENPEVTLEPVKITWRESVGNEETTKSVDGYRLQIKARVNASDTAESGDVILSVPGFESLEQLGLYMVEVSGGVVTPNGRAEPNFDAGSFVVATIE